MSSKSSSSGIGCGTVIFLILLFLKIFGLIDISWWWVFAPLIIGVAISIILFIILLIIMKN